MLIALGGGKLEELGMASCSRGTPMRMTAALCMAKGKFSFKFRLDRMQTIEFEQNNALRR